MDLGELRRDFDKYLEENNIWMSSQRLDYSLGQLFRGCDLAGKSVLEIGAGKGFSSVWCALRGTDKVVALEPEASGSTKGVREEFMKMVEAIDIESRVKYREITLDKYFEYFSAHKPHAFDYILMKASINHLDEEATRRLHLPEAEAERQRYRNIFKKCSAILNSGGLILIYDVGRRNFWHKFNLGQPFAPTINFDIHQQPEVWSELLCQCGFEFFDLRWYTAYRLRYLRSILSSFIPAYFLASAFILRCKKP